MTERRQILDMLKLSADGVVDTVLCPLYCLSLSTALRCAYHYNNWEDGEQNQS